MTGYVRQSVADIVPNEVIKASPINAEFNAVRDAFSATVGHHHDGSTAEGAYVPLISTEDNLTKAQVDAINKAIRFFVSNGASAVEQAVLSANLLEPSVDNLLSIGSSTKKIKDFFVSGTASIGTLSVTGNATVSGTATLPNVVVTGGTVDNTTVGATTASTVRGTLITALTGFVGNITGSVTGNVTGNLTGNVTGNVVGNVTGNVTAATGTSTFNDVTIHGNLNMDAGTTSTITNLSTPTATGDAATKGYVDTSISNLVASAPTALDTLNELATALGNDANFATTVTNLIATKLSLAGGTMTGAIAMGGNKVTGLGTPTASADAVTKSYTDAADALKLNLTGGTLSGALAMGGNKITSLGAPAVGTDATTKDYVDGILGSATSAATSAAAAAASASQAATSATNAATSATSASSSATAAATSASTAGTAATAASASASAAATSETNAAASATSASTSATNASTSATNAANSATSAATSATSAAISESNAATSATASAASASASAASETNAATSETSAAASAAAAALSYDSFDDRYLGAKSSAPTLDNDGNTLLTGALYWDTTATSLYIWTGSAWSAAAFDTAGAMFGVNNLSDLDNVVTARTNLGVAIGTDVQAYNAGTVVDATYVHTDNNYTTTEKSKLAGIEAGATADQTASEILTAIKTVDGSGSGLDADLLDGNHATAFATAAQGALADSAIQPTDTQTQATWQAGTGTIESLVSPAKVAAAIAVKVPTSAGTTKAWVNFNGTGTVSIRASGNVSSITDTGTGRYTVNFSTAYSDVNYAASFDAQGSSLQHDCTPQEYTGRTASALPLGLLIAGAYADTLQFQVIGVR